MVPFIFSFCAHMTSAPRYLYKGAMAVLEVMDAEDIFAVMAGRKTVKRFSLQPVELDKVLQVIQAGGLAPSSGNIQNWSFIVLTDVGKIRDLYDLSMQQEPFLSAMSAIVVCGDTDYGHTMYGVRGQRLYTVQNCAAAIENMLLAAEALGLGTAWIGAFDEDRLADMLSIPSRKHRPQAIILLGYPEVFKEGKERKPLDSIVFFNQFGNRVLRPHLIHFDWATEWENQAKKMKTHVKTAQSNLRQRYEEKKSRVKERMDSGENPLKKARDKVSDVLDQMKRDEYRKN